VATLWALYGLALALLWQTAGQDQAVQAAVWLGGSIAGVALAMRGL